jgi:hypothetical protein
VEIWCYRKPGRAATDPRQPRQEASGWIALHRLRRVELEDRAFYINGTPTMTLEIFD